mmetsp:Transcript_55411/g.120738  ORF Transcript_55411/g.120738 Transcript_55411/m.120738 type:complete len:281 (-) Transcript_55411:47-889(-)
MSPCACSAPSCLRTSGILSKSTLSELSSSRRSTCSLPKSSPGSPLERSTTLMRVLCEIKSPSRPMTTCFSFHTGLSVFLATALIHVIDLPTLTATTTSGNAPGTMGDRLLARDRWISSSPTCLERALDESLSGDESGDERARPVESGVEPDSDCWRESEGGIDGDDFNTAASEEFWGIQMMLRLRVPCALAPSRGRCCSWISGCFVRESSGNLSSPMVTVRVLSRSRTLSSIGLVMTSPSIPAKSYLSSQMGSLLALTTCDFHVFWPWTLTPTKACAAPP